MSETPRQQLVEPGRTARPPQPIELIRRDLDRMTTEFSVSLPQHIPVDRFKRTVLTAINLDPELLTADRRSLMGAAMRAAHDGLYPDKREGAFVIFNTKVKEDGKDRWIKAVQWMPMVYGIIKKMRNSGELVSIVAHEVYQKDKFHYALGDEEHIDHEPYLGDEEPGKMIAVYAIAKLKDGTVQREVMTRAQTDKVRSVSKSKDSGPWVTWYEEMARKSVVRRLSKYLPMSTEIEDMLRRDDAISAAAETMTRGTGVTIEGEATETEETYDLETGEIIEGEKVAAGEKVAGDQERTGGEQTGTAQAQLEHDKQEPMAGQIDGDPRDAQPEPEQEQQRTEPDAQKTRRGAGDIKV